MPELKTKCNKCGTEILLTTAARTEGLCMPCKAEELRLLQRSQMIAVNAPELGLDVCRNEREREFLELLNIRAGKGSWASDVSWLEDDKIVLAVSPFDLDPKHNCVLRTLRIDFYGQRVICGDDETHQFSTDLDPARPDVVVAEGTPVELAELAADWLEREMKCVIVRHEWVRPQFTHRLWVLADTGEGLVVSDSENKDRSKLGPPDRITKVWPP
ncbi:MAG: hypothetical protein ACO1QS_09595 [Verrucomicrobiota bacterium]